MTREIVLTENKYVMGLDVLIDNYQKPLLAKKILSKAQVTDIFDQVPIALHDHIFYLPFLLFSCILLPTCLIFIDLSFFNIDTKHSCL